MITIEQHRGHILNTVARLDVAQATLLQAHGCVLAQDVSALIPVPAFDNSAMDGYAVRAEDVAGASRDNPRLLPVAADLPAGSTDDSVLVAGTAMRIMTGAPIPSGADCIIPVEDTDQRAGWNADAPDRVAIFVGRPAGTFVRQRGDDVAPRAVVIPAGRVLGPRDLGAAASVGHGTLPVIRRPKVGILPTGEELVTAGSPLGAGQTPDSNGPMLLALLTELGVDAVDLGTVGDDREEFRLRIDRAAADLDAIITIGGISAGAFDVVKAVMQDEADVEFAQFAMQPGKPQGFGTIAAPSGRRVVMFCLPGNPVSVYVSTVLFVAPALRVMAGLVTAAELEDLRKDAHRGIADVSWRGPVGRRQLMPVLIETRDGVKHVRPSTHGGSGSHLAASLATAHALATPLEGADEVATGDQVLIITLPDRRTPTPSCGDVT